MHKPCPCCSEMVKHHERRWTPAEYTEHYNVLRLEWYQFRHCDQQFFFRLQVPLDSKLAPWGHSFEDSIEVRADFSQALLWKGKSRPGGEAFKPYVGEYTAMICQNPANIFEKLLGRRKVAV